MHQRDAIPSHMREQSSDSVNIIHSSVSKTYIANGLRHMSILSAYSYSIFKGRHHFLTGTNKRSRHYFGRNKKKDMITYSKQR